MIINIHSGKGGNKDSRMEREFSFGQTALNTRDSSKMTNSMVRESTTGQTESIIKVHCFMNFQNISVLAFSYTRF